MLLGHNFFPPQLNRRRPVPVDSPQFVGYIYGGAKASVINKNKSYPGKSNETMDHLYLKPLFGGRLVDPKKKLTNPINWEEWTLQAPNLATLPSCQLSSCIARGTGFTSVCSYSGGACEEFPVFLVTILVVLPKNRRNVWKRSLFIASGMCDGNDLNSCCKTNESVLYDGCGLFPQFGRHFLIWSGFYTTTGSLAPN